MSSDVQSSITPQTLKDPIRSLTSGYILALTIIAVMSISIYLISDRMTAEQNLRMTAIDTQEPARISELQTFQRGAVLVILLTLVGEAIFIFRPLVRRAHDYAEELKRITMTDLLTGIGNRRFFVVRGDEEIRRARRLKKDLCLALIDLDRFKDINDNYGHKSGDMVLQQFVRVAKEAIRREDVFARIGGEEFGVLLPHTRMDDAQIVMERMRAAIDAHEFKLDGKLTGRLTMSAGLTRVNLAQDDFEAALVLADVALYDAKRTGRNKVVIKDTATFFDPAEAGANVVSLKPL